MGQRGLDDYTLREQVREQWRNRFKWNSASLPGNLLLSREGGTVVLTVASRLVLGLPEDLRCGLHLGESSTSFDAYAAALRAISFPDDKIRLNVPEEHLPEDDGPQAYMEYCNYARFLYRCLRFREQHFDWFELSSNLSVHVDKFAQWFRNGMFEPIWKASRPGRRASNSGATHFASDWSGTLRVRINFPSLGPSGSPLPLGLRVESLGAKRGASLFANASWGPDVWEAAPRRLGVFQVRSGNLAKKVGVLSELFIFANLALDVYTNRLGNIQMDNVPEDSDYRKVHPTRGVIAGLLLEEGTRHPLVVPEVLKVYQQTLKPVRIHYEMMPYEVERARGRETPIFTAPPADAGADTRPE